MAEQRTKEDYRPTESKYKGGAKEMYVTYDLEQETRGEKTAFYPKVKRVYIAGDVLGWQVGTFEKKSGRTVYGMKIEYKQSRAGYERSSYTAQRSDTGTEYEVPPSKVEERATEFSQIVELPEDAKNVDFHTDQLPAKYQDALQDVR